MPELLYYNLAFFRQYTLLSKAILCHNVEYY